MENSKPAGVLLPFPSERPIREWPRDTRSNANGFRIEMQNLVLAVRVRHILVEGFDGHDGERGAELPTPEFGDGRT